MRRLVRDNPVKNAIVFCNRKRDVDVVAKSLQKHGFSAAPLHGDLDQSVRTRTLEAFKNGEVRLLVASDVAARGLDIPAVSHIFNFDVPFHADDYVHRIGRTGRAGRSGHAYMLASGRDAKQVEAIERLIGLPIAKRVMENLEVREDRPDHHNRDPHRRNGRDRNRGQDRRPHEHKPAEARAPAPQPEAPRHVEPPRREQQPQRHQQKPQAAKPAPRHAEPERSDVNQLPAFLLRPINLPKTEKPAKPPKRKDAGAEV